MRILLTRDKVTVINFTDYPLVKYHRWWTSNIGDKFYACAYIDGRQVSMHQWIMGRAEGCEIDHKDNDGLNNRRSNLRVCTHSNNMRSRQKNKEGVGYTSKYKGVSWHKEARKWRAKIVVDDKYIHLGFYRYEIVAATAYDIAAKEYFGEFAMLNFKEAI